MTASQSASLVLLRHGQSAYNLANRFTGWLDVDLTPHGAQQASFAGQACRHIQLDTAFCSDLKRANQTVDLFCQHYGKPLPVTYDAALKERDYGQLNGLNKQSAIDQYGQAQVFAWRRHYDACPPGGESLAMTEKRVAQYYQSSILPHLSAAKGILIGAHGNSLRALVKHIFAISYLEISQLEIACCEPWVLRFSGSQCVGLHIIKLEQTQNFQSKLPDCLKRFTQDSLAT